MFSFKTSSSAATVTFNNLISNAPIEKIGDQVWTKGENITGYTYRFYADITVTNTDTKSGNLVVRNLDAGSTTHINSTSFTIKKSGEWTTFYHDYKINPDDFSVKVDKDAYTYADPAFGFYAASGTRTYCFDNLKVVVFIDPVSVASSGIVLEAVNAIVDNSVAIEAEISSASNGDIIVIGGETVLTVADGKLYYGETVLGDAKGKAFELTETPETITAVYDDVTGRIRFAFRGGFACDETGALIYAKVFNYGVSEDATIEGDVEFSVIKRTPELVGYQTKDTHNAVRFIAGVDSLYYSKIGFEVNTVGGSVYERANPGVCSSVIAEDITANAADYGYEYMSLLSITEIATDAEDTDVTVRPYFLIGSAKIYGEAVTYSISIVNNAVVVE